MSITFKCFSNTYTLLLASADPKTYFGTKTCTSKCSNLYINKIIDFLLHRTEKVNNKTY